MLSDTPSPLDSFGLDPSAINTSSSSHREKKKKKKNKRPHEDDTQDEHSAEPPKRHKPNDTQEDEDDVVEITDLEYSQTTETTETSKKKKKKDKGKSKATSLSEQTDAEIEATSQASAAALLSAIVAASVTNADAPQMQPPPPVIDPNLTAPPPEHQYDPYPPMHPYGYPLASPPPFNDPNVPAPSAFSLPPSTGGGGAFSELSFSSNEDLLRALQNLDMSKIASVLKSLGDAASSNNAQNATPLSYVPAHLMQLPPTTIGQYPAPSNSILGIDPKRTMASLGPRTINMSLPGNEQHTNPEHAYILANKWLNPSKLAELVRDEGLVYKKGKFSAIEEQQLKAAIENYRQAKQLDRDGLVAKIYTKYDKSKDTAFWSELTAAVPLRPIIAVYHHVRRTYHPLKQRGMWQADEDEALIQAVADYGQQWEKVSFRVGRMASDCRDRYRNHIYNREVRVTGPWSKEEEDRLTEIVLEMTIKQGKNPDNDVFWGRVSELMGGSRGRQQCRIKWTDALSKTVKNEGQKPRWSQQDAFILVHKVDSLNVRDDTEIDWKLIPDPDWNLWSAHTLQRRWLTMKKGVKGYEDMTHQEIMDILRVKKAHLPTLPQPTTRKKKERKVVSAPAVNDPDMRDNDSPPQAGSSTGPGTGAPS